MENINDYKKRFFKLMESTIGNVKPLLFEQIELPSTPFKVDAMVGENRGTEITITNIERKTGQLKCRNGQVFEDQEWITYELEQKVDYSENKRFRAGTYYCNDIPVKNCSHYGGDDVIYEPCEDLTAKKIGACKSDLIKIQNQDEIFKKYCSK